jgi:integrase
LAQWSREYFDSLAFPTSTQHNAEVGAWSGPKRPATIRSERTRAKSLVEFFGDMPLCDIKAESIRQYRQARMAHVKFPSVNRELTFLNYLLGWACEKEILETVPKIRNPSEKGRARTDSVTPEQYGAILEKASRELQRVIICWYETGMRHEEVFHLTWAMIDLKAHLIRMPSNIVKEKVPRRCPISFELRAILLELKELRLKTGARHDFVFIRESGAPIVDITKGFAKAADGAGCAEIRPHSFRRACITRWTDLGIAPDIVKRASGHVDGSVHGDYLIFTDDMMVKPFREKGLLSAPAERKQAVAS